MSKIIGIHFLFMAGLLLCQACHSLDEKSIFNYPVDVVDMPEVTGTLAPEEFSELEYLPRKFYMLGDSVILNYDPMPDSFFSFVDAKSGKTISTLCRRGRGPDEMLFPSIDFDIYGGFAPIVDGQKAIYYQVNLVESLKQNRTIIERSVKLTGKDFFKSSYCGTFQDKLICLDSQLDTPQKLFDSPYFSVFDLNDGHHLADYHPFGKIPLEEESYMKVSIQSILSLRCTSNRKTEQVFFANYLAPQVAFLDCESGDIRGIRFGEDIKMSLTKPVACFTAVCSDEDRIYAMFYGKKLGDKSSNPKLMVLDWSGNVKGMFQLAGPYYNMSISEDYLHFVPNDDKKLFRLPLSDIPDIVPATN